METISYQALKKAQQKALSLSQATDTYSQMFPEGARSGSPAVVNSKDADLRDEISQVVESAQDKLEAGGSGHPIKTVQEESLPRTSPGKAQWSPPSSSTASVVEAYRERFGTTPGQGRSAPADAARAGRGSAAPKARPSATKRKSMGGRRKTIDL